MLFLSQELAVSLLSPYPKAMSNPTKAPNGAEI
jgi:hypothetical protein